MMEIKKCEREFEQFELLYIIPEGFEDVSWHNDAMPNFVDEENGLQLWINYPIQGLRENHMQEEFLLCQFHKDDKEMAGANVTLYSGNNWVECINAIKRARDE